LEQALGELNIQSLKILHRINEQMSVRGGETNRIPKHITPYKHMGRDI
jgi:hypothetical protein